MSIPAPSREDAAVFTFHNIRYTAWLRLTPTKRAELTDQYYAAQGAWR